MTSSRRFASVIACLAAGSLVFGQQQPPQVTFRSGVDLVLIDATVLDKNGTPIADLQPGDFTVTLAGKNRPVVAVQYVTAGRAPVSPAIESATPQARGGPATRIDLTSALPPMDERSIVIAVDVENIRSGEGRIAMENLADYVDTLPPTDKVGVVTLPIGSKEIQFTNDRAATRAVLSRTFGHSGQMRSCDPTSGEAAAHSVGDERGFAAYDERARRGLGCPGVNVRRLEAAIPGYRAQTQRVLQVLTDIASALGQQPSRRAMMLVSEGLFGDDVTRRFLPDFAQALERARVVLFGIHLDFPMMEASVKGVHEGSRFLEDRYGFDAMAEAAVAGGGETARAISRATPALRRIDAALSGVYVLAVDRIAGDTEGKRLNLKVEVNRKGADLRARSQITIQR